ncbi:MAG: hypothetical protein H6704_05115 [Myxococcales bacterium]|nr:hypothetical protein [Myxococcales bacterium]
MGLTGRAVLAMLAVSWVGCVSEPDTDLTHPCDPTGREVDPRTGFPDGCPWGSDAAPGRVGPGFDAAGPPEAAAPRLDGGRSPDAAPPPDAGARLDGGRTPDAAPPPDAGAGLDGGRTPDAAPSADARAELDDGRTPDAVSPPDAGARLDRGRTPDAAPTLDAAGRPDVRPTQDVAPPLDQGQTPDAALPAPALTKPRMLVVFDTSGSMTWTPRRARQCVWNCGMPQQGACYADNDASGCPPGVPCLEDSFCAPWTYGDGSADYPGVDHDGNGLADDSRMFIAKEALRSTLLGVTELEFGLMRYAQEEGDLIRSTGICSGCEQLFRSQYDAYPFAIDEGAINYDGQLISCQRGGELLVPIADDARGAIVSWMDHVETFPYDVSGNRELRGDGNTPIAGSLRSALTLFRDQVIPGDERQNCRPYFVLLLTDGEETCETAADGGPDQAVLEAAARDLLELRVEGRATPVRTFVIGFGEDTEGSATLDAIAAAGGTDQAHFGSDEMALQRALSEIIQQVITQESCN